MKFIYSNNYYCLIAEFSIRTDILTAMFGIVNLYIPLGEDRQEDGTSRGFLSCPGQNRFSAKLDAKIPSNCAKPLFLFFSFGREACCFIKERLCWQSDGKETLRIIDNFRAQNMGTINHGYLYPKCVEFMAVICT